MTEQAYAFGGLVVRTKLVAPRLKSHVLPRPRLEARLARALEHPLTIVKAAAGYGKTTALQSLRDHVQERLYWYSLGEADTDPLVFLLHLVAAFRATHPACGDRALAMLEQEGGAAKHWAAAVNALANDLFEALRDDAVLVLDDYHLVNRRDVNAITDRLIEHMPPALHVVIATRHAPALPRLARRRALGDVLDLTRADLAFTAEEVDELFKQRYGLPLADGQAHQLAAETEGWPIALQMVWQNLQRGAAGGLDELLRRMPDSLEGLFAYLAEEVLAEQPPAVQEFLLRSSVLRRMDAGSCDRLLRRHDSELVLRELEERSLLVTSLGGGAYRYHHLVHDFLARRAKARSPGGWRRLHRTASRLYRDRGDLEEAIHHAIEAGSLAEAAELLEEVGAGMIQSGRYETLAGWLGAIPEQLLDEHPELLRVRGDALRLSSCFDAALKEYARAGQRFAERGDPEGESRALEGGALVYLDTVQPTKAEPLLRRALRLAGHGDRARRAHLLLLLAENSANRGDLERAERVQRVVRRWQGGSASEIDPRIYVRQGRLAEAKALAERALRREEADAKHGVPRSHRESTAVLAWISAFMGEAEDARLYAERALRRGRELRAPIVEVVALSRLGHAWLTGADADPERALGFYRQSLDLAERIGVARFRVESLIGRVVAYGLDGRVAVAEELAQEALAVLEEAGDRYLASVVWLALGAAGVVAQHPQASAWLETGAALARRCGDRYGPCVADLWRARLALAERDASTFETVVGRALRAADAHGLGFLFTSHPFLGLKRPSDVEDVLRGALRGGVEPELARYFLRQAVSETPDLVVEAASAAPIVTVRALGPFRVWRGGEEIAKSAWSRGKALQLFQFLLCHGGRPVHREQAQEALWPGARPEASAVGLRVALSALQRALEPDRARGREPRYVRRQGQALALDTDLVRVDAEEFAALVRRAREREAAGTPEMALEAYRQALTLYRGDYLEESVYEDWAAERRQELLGLYLRAADRTAELLIQRGGYEEAIEICEQILLRDRCWEHAYALSMRAHAALGNRALALRAYERCRRHLAEDLGVAPSPELRELRAGLAYAQAGR